MSYRYTLLRAVAGVPDTEVEMFPSASIPVVALSFIRQGATGVPETSLTGEGEISYPDYAALPKVMLRASDVLTIEGLSQFRIENISGATTKGLRFRLTGVASHIMTSSGEFVVDNRRTRFDARRGVKIARLRMPSSGIAHRVRVSAADVLRWARVVQTVCAPP